MRFYYKQGYIYMNLLNRYKTVYYVFEIVY